MKDTIRLGTFKRDREPEPVRCACGTVLASVNRSSGTCFRCKNGTAKERTYLASKANNI